MKTIKAKKIAAMFIVAILASMIIEGICNFNIIKLPEEKSGV
ncbi:hypothetical protein [Dorea formicigenerans]|nr:hypothetical protein [uncultured Dorea sp.]